MIDNGLFVGVAERLARDFGKVYYWTPWIETFARQSASRIGRKLPGVERIDYWETIEDEVDLWVFPDCYFGPMQLALESRGHRVFGSRMGEQLELYREEAKEYMKEVGIPIGPYQCVTGVEELRKVLKEKKNVRVKRSFYRADMESFHSPNYRLIEPRLEKLEHDLGPQKYETPFIVEDSIDNAVEIGYDGYTIDGQFPSSAMYGLEIKSKAYVGHFTDYDKMPTQIRTCNEKLAPYLKEHQYRNWLSLEMRVTKDGTPWVIDPCCRWGNPPGALCTLMYKNLADIFWFGADGKLVDPEPMAEYGCQITMYSSFSEREWQPIYFPKDLNEHVILVNATVINGTHYVIPGPDNSSAVGSVVAYGNTLKAAMEDAKDIAGEVEGYDLDIHTDSCGAAEHELEKMKSFGIHF